MGRRSQPVEGPVNELVELAAGLRRLRAAAGNPPLRAMAMQARYSASTLSEAASGRRLPTLPVVLAYAAACGGDAADWEARWRRAAEAVYVHEAGSTGAGPGAAVTDAVSDAVPSPPAEERAEHEPSAEEGAAAVTDLPAAPQSGRRWRPRGTVTRVTVAITGVAAVAAVIIGFGSQHAPSAVRAHVAVLRTLSASPAGQQSRTAPVFGVTPEPERRHGPLGIVPGTVVDLDSFAPDWGARTSPGTADDDIEFTSTDHILTGLRNADMAILPASDVGTFDQCALEQNYGVELPAAAIRPGVLLCDITSDNRVAMLRIIDVQRDADGTPDQITLDVTVWVRLHQN